MKMEEEMKKINENFDSAIKVIEKNKELFSIENISVSDINNFFNL